MKVEMILSSLSSCSHRCTIKSSGDVGDSSFLCRLNMFRMAWFGGHCRCNTTTTTANRQATRPATGAVCGTFVVEETSKGGETVEAVLVVDPHRGF